jgi:di/tricarboxylate transporter
MSQPSATSVQQPTPLPSKDKIPWVKVGGAIGAILTFIIIRSLSFAGLSSEAQGVLAILLASVILWVTQPIPIAYTCLIMIVLPWVLGYITPAVSFSGFSGTTFWLVFAVLGMGSCVGSSIFSKRLSLLILSMIGKPTFKRVLLASMVTMFVLGYFIPSTTAKVAILIALILPIVVLFGVQTKSNIGMILAIALSQIASATQILTPTANPLTAMIYGILNGGGVNVSFGRWTVIALIPVILTFVGYYFFMSWYAKPEATEAIGGREKILADLKALPAMSIKEIWVMVVTLGIMVGFLAGLNTTMVAIVGVLLYVLPGIGAMSFSDFMAKGVHWETLIMVGSLLAISPMLSEVGLTDVVTQVLSIPFSFATNPFLFVMAMALLSIMIYAFILIMPTIPLVVPIIMNAAPLAGVSPILGGMMLLAFVPQFMFWCVAPMFGIAMKDEIGNVKDWVITGVAFFLISVVVWVIYVYLAPAIGLIP